MKNVDNYIEPKIFKIVNKTVLLLIGLFISSASMDAQVKGINYGIEFNKETCLFDCYMIVKEGYARTMKERVQFNAQITIVTPAGSEMVVEEVYMPLKDNQNFRSEEPADWYISNVIKSPIASPENNFFSLAPALAPSAFYNTIVEGEKIRLFSLSITPIVDCAKEVRIFNNAMDPSSEEKGMSGSDFRNGFTMGGIEQIYNGNEEEVLPVAPIIGKVNVEKGKTSLINLEVSSEGKAACQNSITYKWYGPKGLLAETTQPSLEINTKVNGEYFVIAKDELGCESKMVFQPFETTFANDFEPGEGVISNTSEFSSDVYGMSIFPNPAKDYINFSLRGRIGDQVIASIYDQSGRLIKSNILSMRLSQAEEAVKTPIKLPSGLYTISTVINNHKLENQKLIIID